MYFSTVVLDLPYIFHSHSKALVPVPLANQSWKQLGHKCLDFAYTEILVVCIDVGHSYSFNMKFNITGYATCSLDVPLFSVLLEKQVLGYFL